MNEEELRAVLMWLVERDVMEVGAYSAPCVTCGHDRHAHVVAGDADNPTPWPCTFPMSMGAPHPLCRCTDYQPMSEEP